MRRIAKPKRIGIKQLHAFVMGPLVKHLHERYEKYEILSESDLQAHVWQQLSDFIRRTTSQPENYKVVLEPLLEQLNIHPDVVIFYRRKPWVLMELKEIRRLSKAKFLKDWNRLLRAKNSVKPKRGYLLYLTRYGKGELRDGPKKNAAKYCFEVPICLEAIWTTDRIKSWEKVFYSWSRYHAPRRTKNTK